MNPVWLIALVVLAVLAVFVVIYASSTDRRSEPDAYERTPIPRLPSGWPIIARADNGLTAKMIQNMLKSDGIESVVEESHFSRLYFAGSEPGDMNTPVYVKPGDEDEARKILGDSDFARHLV